MISEDIFTAGLGTINRAGFLKRADDAIQVYSPYLSFVKDVKKEPVYSALRQILLEPGFNKELFVVGYGVYRSKEYGTARQLFEEFVKREPNVEAGHYRLALTYMQLNQAETAILHFMSAIALKPRFFSALFRLADAYERAGKPDLAEAAYLSARAVQLEDHPAHLLALSELLRLSDQPKEALDLITECLHEDPTIRHGWGLKGQLLLRLGKDELAQAAFKEAVAREPDAFVHFGLGQVARGREDWAQASESFQAAITFDPHLSSAYPLLGQALLKVKRTDDAIKVYRKAIELDESSPQAYFGLGLAFRQKRNWPEAAVQFELATDKDPAFAEAFSYLGTAFERTGELEKALEAHKRAAELNPQSETIQFGHAQALAKAGKADEAIAVYETCLRINPTFKLAADRLRALREHGIDTREA
jgi:protein O-GlcNAc transferase